MKTILFFDHTAHPGGGEIALLRLVSALNRERYTPVVLLAAEGCLHPQLSAAGVETHLLPLAPGISETRKETLGPLSLFAFHTIGQCWAYAEKLAAFIRSRKIDLLHTNSLKADLIGAVAARMARIPVVWHVRDRIAADYLPAGAAAAFRAACRHLPAHVIANSRATIQTLGPANATVVYDGMPLLAEPPPAGVPAGPPVIGLLGRISPWKGQHVLIRAARLVRREFPSARFRIIGAPLFGEQRYERELHQLAVALGLNDAVEFTGFRENIRQELERLSIVIHASTVAEPLGQVVFEAMYYSRPVIASNAGGVREIVENGETGLLVPMGDETAMAAAICRLLARPAEAIQMGVNGRRRVLEYFTIAQTARGVEAVYDNVLGNL